MAIEIVVLGFDLYLDHGLMDADANVNVTGNENAAVVVQTWTVELLLVAARGWKKMIKIQVVV